MKQTGLTQTKFEFPGQRGFYRGKVRDVYFLENDLLVMIASDRISAFDVVLPRPIPNKGQVLNQTANHFLDLTRQLVPNWKISSPDPMVTIGRKAEPLKVEMVIRGYLTGHAWREYKRGKREICGVPMPDGMVENQQFPQPIITPTTKADQGEHDQDISKEEILERKIVTPDDYKTLEKYTKTLFEHGQLYANKQGLILVDTKYEFGKDADGRIILIDEIHTPDSSRYFYLEGYKERLEKGEPQRQLSKEFVREWLMENGFQGKDGESIPEMTDDFVDLVSKRYVELYQKVTGKSFEKESTERLDKRIMNNTLKALESL